MPDDLEDLSEPPECPLAAQCITGGNHILILTPDDHLMTFNHLRQDSIPPHLCPIDEVIVRADEPKEDYSLPTFRAAMRDIARLDLRGIAPIPVAAGEYIGKVGVSGQAGGVHVHMGIAQEQQLKCSFLLDLVKTLR